MRWWLDFGSLLGALRDKDPLLGGDFDVGVTAHDPRLGDAWLAFAQDGWAIRPKYLQGVPWSTTLRKEDLVVDVHLYRMDTERWLWRGGYLPDRSPFVADPCYWYAKASGWMNIQDRGRFPYRSVWLSAPWRFFWRLGRVKLNGQSYPVPHHAREYLTMKYGEWQAPRPGYRWWRDDGMIMPVEAEGASRP